MRTAMNLFLAAALCGTPFLAGCDRTVSEDKTVKEHADGSMKIKDEKVTQNSDGTMTKTTETKTNNP